MRATWVWLYSPRRYSGRCPKWQRLYSGPYLVVKQLGAVNVVLQKTARTKRFVSHVDKLKRCLSATPASWVDGEGEAQTAVKELVVDQGADEGGPMRAEVAGEESAGSSEAELEGLAHWGLK